MFSGSRNELPGCKRIHKTSGVTDPQAIWSPAESELSPRHRRPVLGTSYFLRFAVAGPLTPSGGCS